MEVFATFDIFDVMGTKVAQGHKASFCLEDSQCMPGIPKKYDCANFGDQGKDNMKHVSQYKKVVN